MVLYTLASAGGCDWRLGASRSSRCTVVTEKGLKTLVHEMEALCLAQFPYNQAIDGREIGVEGWKRGTDKGHCSSHQRARRISTVDNRLKKRFLTSKSRVVAGRTCDVLY